jgi:hypothetical protein
MKREVRVRYEEVRPALSYIEGFAFMGTAVSHDRRVAKLELHSARISDLRTRGSPMAT